MGRKSSAKAQTRSTPGGAPPPEEPRRSTKSIVGIAAIVIAAALGIFVATRPTEPQPSSAPTTAAQSAPQPPADATPQYAKFGPHKQESLPPLPFDGSPTARPPDVVRAAYQFAAEHPEVLSYVPCYCGCERSGHRGNDDCFVSARDAKGDVTQWEPHGMT
jgi:Protein of unknown function with PCYCGC motif